MTVNICFVNRTHSISGNFLGLRLRFIAEMSLAGIYRCQDGPLARQDTREKRSRDRLSSHAQTLVRVLYRGDLSTPWHGLRPKIARARPQVGNHQQRRLG